MPKGDFSKTKDFVVSLRAAVRGGKLAAVIDHEAKEIGALVTASKSTSGEVSVSDGEQKIVLIGGVADPIKAVVISAGYAYLRAPWNDTLDAVHKIRIYGPDTAANYPVDFYGVNSIPIGTENSVSAILAATASGTVLANQGDSIGPFHYNNTYIGANHGPFIRHSVTCTGHGKSAVDVGSEWSGPSSRKFYIFKVVDADTLWLVSDNTGTTAHWYFYTTSLASQTLAHSAGASNAASIIVSADTVGQLVPALNNRSLRVEVDGVAIDHTAEAIHVPKISFKIFEAYSVVSPAAAVVFMKANVGNNPSFYDDRIAADVSVNNVHSFQSTGAHTVDQTVTWHQAVSLGYQGVVQDWPPVSQGALAMYIPGVSAIGGVDYKAVADISGTITPFSTPKATWIDQGNAPNRMAQLTSASSVNKVGVVLGYSPLTGLGTRIKRAAAAVSDAGGMLSNATKKMYPRANGVSPAAGESYRVVGYQHVYNCESVPDATIATWFVDGNDVVVVLDFHKTSAISRVSLPEFCDGWVATLIDSQNVTLLTTQVVDGGGIAVTCSASYGYAIIRVAKR